MFTVSPEFIKTWDSEAGVNCEEEKLHEGFPGGANGQNPPANAGDARDPGLIPGPGRSDGVGNGNPLQYSYLENSMDRGACWATVHGATKSRTQLSMHAALSYKDGVMEKTKCSSFCASSSASSSSSSDWAGWMGRGRMRGLREQFWKLSGWHRKSHLKQCLQQSSFQ